MKFVKLAALSAVTAVGLSTAAFAQDPAVGATVFGPEGNEVGSVEAIADGLVTINTGKHQVPLPADSLGTGPDGPVVSVTKVQLNTMMDEQLAAAAEARDGLLLEGAAVVAADSAPLGVIESIDGDNIVVTRESGPVALKREHFVATDGTLMALFTVEQIEAAMASQTAG